MNLPANIPEEWIPIVDYLERFPGISIHSSRISSALSREGIEISSMRISTILRKMYLLGLSERRERRSGPNIKRVFYRISQSRPPEILADQGGPDTSTEVK